MTECCFLQKQNKRINNPKRQSSFGVIYIYTCLIRSFFIRNKHMFIHAVMLYHLNLYPLPQIVFI